MNLVSKFIIDKGKQLVAARKVYLNGNVWPNLAQLHSPEQMACGNVIRAADADAILMKYAKGNQVLPCSKLRNSIIWGLRIVSRSHHGVLQGKSNFFVSTGMQQLDGLNCK